MEALAEFVKNHMSDDTTRLILDKGKWPEIDMDLAVNCIESRRKLRGKVQEWHDEPALVFPRKLSAEQCSSSATAGYKADLAARIALADGIGSKKWKIADLTGGLGVDSWFFSKKANKVLYNEMQEALCMAAKHNFVVLGASNIEISNSAIVNNVISSDPNVMSSAVETSPATLLVPFLPDIVYMDPARRGEGGKKVFLIEECSPDVLTLKDEIFTISRHILLKLSPMADISMVCNRLGSTCREVHVVAAGGECKELIIWMDREWKEEYSIHAVEISSEGEATEFVFTPSEEKEMAGHAGHDENREVRSDVATYLFEPGKALMKSGAFNLMGKKFGITKLGRSTHYYIVDTEEKAETLSKHGKLFRIIRMEPLDKRSMKAAGKEFPKAEVTARNIPMDTDALRKRLGVTSGGNTHIFGLRSDTLGNLLITTVTA